MSRALKVQQAAMEENLRRFKAEVFQALANATRIAIVELLRDQPDMPVMTVYERLQLEQSNVSQHLAILRAKHIVVARKSGNQVLYSLRDPILGEVLDLMKLYFHSHVEESLTLLQQLKEHHPPKKRSASRSKK